MQIELNGKLHPLPDGATLEQLIAGLSLAGKAVAVAVNRQVVPGVQWPTHALAEADKVDVVRAIGGG
ncbi:sulfur carrier protein ThiS [Herbaspirillum sp. AP02]|uniref:sulfur carrier protein ThiS n=1 Tax=unclassified Herbaspirillum TaxID=2624150 RepID=UPI0015D97D36|nr:MULTISPECIES: sulfur carrier protein ThiS [unclassified Herbaspirillum]MBG7620236.1 sulfur carrier protein ThiS [Herbaspirillum sp. AP02]NZD67700.1 sulfur carrier protein ThiS [Herbaspirillum sp. AP21]